MGGFQSSIRRIASMGSIDSWDVDRKILCIALKLVHSTDKFNTISHYQLQQSRRDSFSYTTIQRSSPFLVYPYVP